MAWQQLEGVCDLTSVCRDFISSSSRFAKGYHTQLPLSTSIYQNVYLTCLPSTFLEKRLFLLQLGAPSYVRLRITFLLWLCLKGREKASGWIPAWPLHVLWLTNVVSPATESYPQVLEDNQERGLWSVMLGRHMGPHWPTIGNEVTHSWHLAFYSLASSV